jgi:hypothetical protein
MTILKKAGPYHFIALVFVTGLILAMAAASSIRLIFAQAPLADLLSAILALFIVPISVVVAGAKPGPPRSYVMPAVILLSVVWTITVIGVIVDFDLRALPFREHPANCRCSLTDLTNLIGKQFPKANALLSVVLGAIFASNKAEGDSGTK